MDDEILFQGDGFTIIRTHKAETLVPYYSAERENGEINHGWLDLRDHPERVLLIPEARKNEGLANILKVIAQPCSKIMSNACECGLFPSGPSTESSQWLAGGFVTCMFIEPEKNTKPENFIELAKYILNSVMLDNSMRSRRQSVEILPDTKERIRNYLRALRECIEKANLTDAKREALLKRLDEFTTELEKRRMNLFAVTQLTLTLLALPGGIWDSAEIAHKLIHNVTQAVADAHQTEQETRQLPPPSAPKVLSPPRKEKNNDESLDDSIPF